MIQEHTKMRCNKRFESPIGPGMGALSRFRRSESGAVSVDWVVLTAAVVGLGAAVALTIGSGTIQGASKMEKCMNIQGKIYSRDIAFDKKLKRIARRCGRL